jgi:hypothetical protein
VDRQWRGFVFSKRRDEEFAPPDPVPSTMLVRSEIVAQRASFLAYACARMVEYTQATGLVMLLMQR